MADADVSADALKARIIRAKLGTPSGAASPPPSFMSGVGTGLMDKLYGLAQTGAHATLDPPPIAYTDEQAQAAQVQPQAAQALDTQLQEREKTLAGQGYNQGWGRTAGGLAGDVALTAPLAVLGGAPGFLAGAARGLGVGAAGGLVGALSTPETSGDFETGKAKQLATGVGIGAATGGVLGGLGGAIARNDPEAAAQVIRKAYYRGVKPGETMTAGQVRTYDNQVREAVDAIIDTRAGKPLPKSPEDFSNAIAETKKAVYPQYSGMAQQAEQKGARVELKPAIDRLTKLVSDPLQDPAATAEAKRLLEMAKGATAITPSRAEEIMGFLNERATGFDTLGTKGAGAVFREAASALRGSLVDAVEGAGFKDYGKLRRTYGALSEIEDHVAQAAKLERNRGGPGIGITDIGAAGLVGAGEPVSAATVEGGKFLSRWLKSPNRAISKLFETAQAERAPSQLAGIRDKVRAMIQRSTPAAAAGAGAEAQQP